MKNIVALLIVLFVTELSAQEINQFDTQKKRHGKWMKKYEGSKQIRYKGQFEHGKEVGQFQFFHKKPKGKQASCIKEFTVSSDVAQVKYYTTYGVLLEEGKMNGKMRIGKWIGYDRKTRAKNSEENYVNGKLEGLKTAYYPNGKVLQTEMYKAGKLNGDKKMYAVNGNLASQTGYTDGRLDGYFRVNDANGKKAEEGKYKMGKPQGVWKYYKAGKLEKTKDYTKSNNPAKQ